MESGSRKNGDIEVLRAVAVCFVILHHLFDTALARPSLAPATAFFDGLDLGGAGVDLFFAISGLVIANTLLPRLGPTTTWRASFAETMSFWTRRAFRLLPTAWLWLAIILAVTAVFSFANPQLDFRTNVDATLAGVFYFANFRFSEVYGIVPYGATFHYWSLSLEEQFYLLLPFVVMIGRRHLAWVLLAIIAFDQLRPIGMDVAVTRMSGLAVGVLLSIWSRQASYRTIRALCAKAPLLGTLVCLLALVGVVAASSLPEMQFKYGMVAACAGLAVLVASFDLRALTPPNPIGNALLWTGARSYALYVIHIPLFLIVEAVWSKADLLVSAPLLLAMLVALALLAELNYRLVEQPLRAYGARLSTRMRQPRPLAPQAA